MNKILNKNTLIFASFALIMAFAIYGVREPNSELKVSLSEPKMNIEQLEEVSDIVVTAELKSIKEKTIKTIITSADDPDSPAAINNEEIKMKAPVIIYNLEIEEFIKGEYKLKNVDLVVPDVNVAGLEGLTEGKLYKLYLEKNEFYGENAFNLVSFTQGYEEVK